VKSKVVLGSILLVLCFTATLPGATHTWTGAVSSSWSNNSNWIGGTPAGDPDADLVFPDVVNKTSTNDIVGVTYLRSIAIQTSDYVIGGNAIALSQSISWSPASGSVAISLPIQVLTNASVSVLPAAAGTTLTLSGPVSGGDLSIYGYNATIVLAADNTNTSTHVGLSVRVFVTGSQSQTAFIVNGADLLGGTGTIGPLNIRETDLSPGTAGAGVFTIQGDSTFSSDTRLKIDINGPIVGSGYDRVSVVGSLYLQQPMGTTTHGVLLDVSAPYSAALGETFTILTTTGTLTGILQAIPDGAVLAFGCQNFRINYTSNSIVLTRVAGGGPPLSNVSISPSGSQNVCTNSTGGTVTVVDEGGCTSSHQWGYRTVSGGAITAIPGETGSTYVIDGHDFPGVGTYYLVETTNPQFGSPMTSNELVVNVAPPPTAVASGSATICPGGSVILSGSGAANCSWTPSTGLSDPDSCNPVASPTVTTTYALTVSGASGCTSTNSAQVTVTVSPDCQTQGPGAFYTVAPCRVLDSRQAGGVPTQPGGSTNVFAIGGHCGVPVGAKAVALNVTVINPLSDGFLTLYPPGTARPPTSAINYRTGQVRANNATIPLDSAGELAVYCGGAGDYDLLIDVSGYYQ
jgi:hypothetical protein